VSGGPLIFVQLCMLAERRGLCVELWTDHRSSAARGPEANPSRRSSSWCSATARPRKAIWRAPTAIRNLDQAAQLGLEEVMATDPAPIARGRRMEDYRAQELARERPQAPRPRCSPPN
jgi:hypothetical protein